MSEMCDDTDASVFYYLKSQNLCVGEDITERAQTYFQHKMDKLMFLKSQWIA